MPHLISTNLPMNTPVPTVPSKTDNIAVRTARLFQEQHQSIIQHTDGLFARLMIFQWIFGVVLALLISPRSWAGTASDVHPHVWASVLLGGLVTAVPVLLAFFRRG